MNGLKEEVRKMCEDCWRHLYAKGELTKIETKTIMTVGEAITQAQKCFPCPVYGQVKNKHLTI